MSYVTLEKTNEKERHEEIRQIFIHKCIDTVCLNGDLEGIKYIVKYKPYNFDNYTPIISNDHKIEVISYLYSALGYKINWGSFLKNMCKTDNLEIVDYLFQKNKFPFADCMFIAIDNKQERIYSYLYEYYEKFYNTLTVKSGFINPTNLVSSVLEKFSYWNSTYTFKWMDKYKLKFCPRITLEYICSNRFPNYQYEEELCKYLYSLHTRGRCRIHQNKCDYIKNLRAAKWVHSIDPEKYDKEGFPTQKTIDYYKQITK